MALVKMKDLLKRAEEKNIAVGSFNTPNLTSLTAILSAAEELGISIATRESISRI